MKCEFCSKIMNNVHGNRKYCSNRCYEKARYKKYGGRCTSEQIRTYYKKRCLKKGYREKLQSQARKRSKKIKQFLANYKLSKGCVDCGYSLHHYVLEFDHIYNNKKFNVCFAKSISSAKKEISKCEVVCSNCHRVRTYNRSHPAETYEDVVAKSASENYERMLDDIDNDGQMSPEEIEALKNYQTNIGWKELSDFWKIKWDEAQEDRIRWQRENEILRNQAEIDKDFIKQYQQEVKDLKKEIRRLKGEAIKRL